MSKKNKPVTKHYLWSYLIIFIVFLLILLGLVLIKPSEQNVDEQNKTMYTEKSEIKIGVLAKRGDDKCIEQWGSTAEYLSNKIQNHKFEIVPLKFEEVDESVENEEVDFVLVNSSMYIELEVNYGVTRLTTLNNKKLGDSFLSFGGVIFTNLDSNIKSIEDLKGCNFAAVNMDSFGGWQTAWKQLLDDNVDPFKHFSNIEFLGTHDDVVYAVLNNDFDAGTVRTDTLERMSAEGLIDLNAIRVLNSKEVDDFPFLLSTKLYPEWPFAKTDHISDELAHEVAVALMEMQPTDKAAKDAQIVGWTVAQNYQVVHEALRSLQLNPYEDYGKVTWHSIIMQYHWALILIVGAFLLVLYLYTRQSLLKEQLSGALLNAKEMEAAATRATRSKSQFLANMSHEIRTPMNAVIGLSQLMSKTELSEKQLDYNQKIVHSANSLLNIINGILDYSKIEAGKMEIENTEFSMDSILESVSSIMSLKAEEKGVELIFDINPNMPRNFSGDKAKLNQVLVNLTNNALKFTEKGSIHVSFSHEIIDDENINLFVGVKDTGIGMSKEQMERLFKPFTQADASTTRQYGGTGLGLAISKELVELMGGTLKVNSKLGEGSTFTFNVSLKIAHHEMDQQILPDSIKGLKVLVIDDNKDIQMVLKRQLESFGFSVIHALDGDEAINKLNSMNELPSLVIVDYQMPNKNGIETIIEMKTQKLISNIPKLMMVTAFGKQEIKNKAKEIGIEVFLDKPVNPSLLFDSIMALFSQKASKWNTEKIFIDDKNKQDKLKLIRGANILLVEDNIINQQIAKEFLVNEGFFVDIVNNGKEAVEKLTDIPLNKYDVVLMDIQMPIMDGRQATRKIREMNSEISNIPIIAMTAHALEEERRKSLSSGMNDQINKPIVIEEVFQVLLKYIKPKNRATNFEQRQKIQIKDIKIDGFETKEGLKRILGDLNLYKRLLTSFKNDYDGIEERIKENEENGLFKDNQLLVHTIKGTGGNLGANSLFKITQKLEDKYKNNEEGDKILNEFIDELNICLKGIDNYLANDTEVKISLDKTDKTRDEMLQSMNNLMDMLIDIDIDANASAEKIYNSLNEVEKNDFDDILNLIENLEYEVAQKRLKSFMSEFSK